MCWRSKGVSAEVIDPRTIVPLDRQKITDSIKKTGRLVVIDESPSFCSFAGELLAIAVEECFDELLVPPEANFFVAGSKSIQSGTRKPNDSISRSYRQRDTSDDEEIERKLSQWRTKLLCLS